MRTRTLNHFHTFYPDEQAEHDALLIEEKRLKMEQARRGEDDGAAPRRRMSEPPVDIDTRLAEIEARKAELKAVIASGVVRITIKGLTRGEFRRLLTDHPPAEDNDLDQRLGYNADTFGEALIQACIIGTHTLDGEPVPNEWDAWADEMTHGQWEEVFTACLKLTTDGEPVFPR